MTDLVSKDRILSHLVDVAAVAEELGIEWAEVIPCSATANDQVDLVRDTLVSLLPEGPKYYPDGETTDEPTETLIGELIREAALEGVRDELPHSIVVERDSQKGIIIGHRGARLREIGTAAREQINRLLGTRVHLNLHVKVLKEWQRDAKHLNRLGF